MLTQSRRFYTRTVRQIKTWRVLTAISVLLDGNTFVLAPKKEPLARMSEYKHQNTKKE
jgi:hypothetical protein